jgi:hypothetical protein
MEVGCLTRYIQDQERLIVYTFYKQANTSFAASTVSSISPCVCAALIKPASYKAGPKYTPRSSMPWNKVLKLLGLISCYKIDPACIFHPRQTSQDLLCRHGNCKGLRAALVKLWI